MTSCLSAQQTLYNTIYNLLAESLFPDLKFSSDLTLLAN